ncbi:MAG: biopolymer transporter ExbD [Muribaculaceae bacterium]|nr:biopolymer transporter ExbD [Muribaculaceae bacterium]
MAQIDTSNDGGKKKKGAQKKIAIHVDFTPMVDMNMLLITFFMLCTTMLKSQTLKIMLPSNDNRIKDEQKQQASKDEAITLILDTEYDANGKPLIDKDGNTVHNIFYYKGMPDTINADAIKLEHFMANVDGKRQGIRKILFKEHEKTVVAYDQLKQRFRNKEIDKKTFDDEAKKLGTDSMMNGKKLVHPVVIIKPGPNATYESLVYAIDELNGLLIQKYAIQGLTHTDTLMLRNYGKANGKEVIRPNIRKR